MYSLFKYRDRKAYQYAIYEVYKQLSQLALIKKAFQKVLKYSLIQIVSY